MSEGKWSSGQWTAEPSAASDVFDCWWLKAGDMEIGTINGFQNSEERSANARLIENAPDLHKALAGITEAVEKGFDAKAWLPGIKLLLARVEGEEP